MRLSSVSAHYLSTRFASNISRTMVAKIVILVCLAVLTKQEPHLAAGFPYIANYASSYDAHTINHDVRVPVAPAAPLVAAYSPVAPVVQAAPFAATVSQTITAVSPLTGLAPASPAVVAPYSVAPVASVVPATATFSAAVPVGRASQPASIQAAPRSSTGPVSEEIKSERPAQSVENPQVPEAVLFASQLLARNAAFQQGRTADLKSAPQENRPVPQEEGNDKNNAALAATSVRFGFTQRANARFAQLRQNDQPKADLRNQQPGSQNAKLIRENEDAESVEINSADSQNYKPENVAVNAPVVAPFASRLRLFPNVYTNVITF